MSRTVRCVILVLGGVVLCQSTTALAQEATEKRADVTSLVRIPEMLRVASQKVGCNVPTQRVEGLAAKEWILELPDRSGYVAWCQPFGSVRRFDLLVAVTPAHPWAKCPSRIVLNLDDTLPDFDLRPLSGVSISFSDFYTLNRDGTMGPAPKDRADASSELAIEWALNLSNNLLVCHQGRLADYGLALRN
jgi:hypothetical protein